MNREQLLEALESALKKEDYQYVQEVMELARELGDLETLDQMESMLEKAQELQSQAEVEESIPVEADTPDKISINLEKLLEALESAFQKENHQHLQELMGLVRELGYPKTAEKMESILKKDQELQNQENFEDIIQKYIEKYIHSKEAIAIFTLKKKLKDVLYDHSKVIYPRYHNYLQDLIVIFRNVDVIDLGDLNQINYILDHIEYVHNKLLIHKNEDLISFVVIDYILSCLKGFYEELYIFYEKIYGLKKGYKQEYLPYLEKQLQQLFKELDSNLISFLEHYLMFDDNLLQNLIKSEELLEALESALKKEDWPYLIKLMILVPKLWDLKALERMHFFLIKAQDLQES